MTKNFVNMHTSPVEVIEQRLANPGGLTGKLGIKNHE